VRGREREGERARARARANERHTRTCKSCGERRVHGALVHDANSEMVCDACLLAVPHPADPVFTYVHTDTDRDTRKVFIERCCVLFENTSTFQAPMGIRINCRRATSGRNTGD